MAVAETQIPLMVMLLVILLGMIIVAGLYIFIAMAYQSIYRKSGHKKPWMAWIPVVNIIPALELGGFSWAWVLLVVGALFIDTTESIGITLLSVIGYTSVIILQAITVISFWKIFKKAGYRGALSLLLLIPVANLVILGIVAWQKKTYKKISAPKTLAKKIVVKKPTKKVVAKKKK